MNEEKYIVATPDNAMNTNLNNAAFISELPFTLTTVATLTQLYATVAAKPDATAIVSAKFVRDPAFDKDSLKTWYCFAPDYNAFNEIQGMDIPYIGIFRSAEELLQRLHTPMETLKTGNPIAPKQQKPAERKPENVQPVAKPAHTPAAPFDPTQMTPEQLQALYELFAKMNGTTPGGAPANTPPAAAKPEKETKKATAIAVYAAKGGVGKTTVATELAAYLSLANNGSRRLSVCVVDYNIDLGDVLSHLNLEAKGTTMLSWIDSINDRLKSEPADKINYDQETIRAEYLQKMQSTGLYALVAPIAHEDTMAIQSDALKVMLRNLIENGGFDVVICDTGNNTRDASVIALTQCDKVLMVVTQDLTTANCNNSVMRALDKSGIDIRSKSSLVINNIVPKRRAGIGTDEIISEFKLPCVAMIQHTADILRANNYGQPLVFKARHPFTQQISKIAMAIVADAEPAATPKRGLSRLFMGKKDN